MTDQVRPREVVFNGRIEDVVDRYTLDSALHGRPYPHPPLVDCGCTACVDAWFALTMRRKREWRF